MICDEALCKVSQRAICDIRFSNPIAESYFQVGFVFEVCWLLVTQSSLRSFRIVQFF